VIDSAASGAAPRAECALPPGGGDHRRAQRRGDHRGQHVQAADQQALAPDLGVAERGACLGVPVHALLHGVDVGERQDILAGQQRRGDGQIGQEHPSGGFQLPDVAPGERAQE